MHKYKKKILKFVYNYIQDQFIKDAPADIRCPNCKEWFAISGINHKHEYLGDIENGCSVRCGQCGYKSHWNLVAFPFPVRVDEDGLFINE